LYVRATGGNRYAGGTNRWLRIRSLQRSDNGVYEIGVRFRGREMVTAVSKGNKPEYLEFRLGAWPNAMPINFGTVIQHWEGKDLWSL
jgi:hypothetical protein